MDQPVFERIKKILIERFNIDADLIDGNAKIEDDLGIDSVEIMDAVTYAEVEFKVKILEKGIVTPDFPETVEGLVDLIAEKINSSS